MKAPFAAIAALLYASFSWAAAAITIVNGDPPAPALTIRRR